MPAASPASIALAARLRQFDEADLAALIRARRVSPAPLADLFDLAEALLDDGAIEQALADLPRASLAALATAGERDPEGRGIAIAELASALDAPPAAVVDALRTPLDRMLAIADGDGTAPDAVTQLTVPAPVSAALARWPARGLPSAGALRDVAAPSPLRPVDVDDIARLDRQSAENAFSAAVRIAELTRALGAEPARLLARGGVSLPDARRVAAAAAIPDDRLDDHLALARALGLAADTREHLIATDAASEWRSRTVLDRWAALADAWRRALPDALREAVGGRAAAGAGDRSAEFIDWLYPAADQALRARFAALARQSEVLGITVDGRVTTVGAAALRDGGAAATASLAPLVPPDVRQVYLQHDLTVVSPGPLAADLDETLRTMADVEAAGLAGRYRLSADSVSRAIAAGHTPEALVAFLTELSLTGVPQPVAYLIDETARRYGAIRVGMLSVDEATDLAATTSIRSDDTVLIDALAVDPTLGPLNLTRTGPRRLVSRLDPGIVLGALIDGRYPAAPEEGEHPIVASRPARSSRGRSPSRPPASGPAPDPVVEAARRLHGATSSADAAGGDAWVARQWELALRAKLPVRATVRLPDGSERTFELEPSGIAAGRVRGRDLAADVERTLPIASITALEVPDA